MTTTKIFFQIEKPTTQDQDILKHYELTSLIYSTLIRMNKKKILSSDLPMTEWRKILPMAPEDVKSKSLEKQL